MPITKDDFERIDDEEPPDGEADRLLDFLIRNDEKAYTKAELTEEVDSNRERVGTLLDRLKERGSVERKSDYWRVSDHELAARAGTGLTAETARQYDDGEEFDVERWAEYAVDNPEQVGETE
ncbi:MarR family transcriptional regulator [Halorussus salilacus]|uniref:MarR family transcriptional regulator n=1 Tax=Halorussus salilacus TaxID=2953750 RepID=UPI00209C8C23|nr:helix-turn-helix domain-containing protein [Halorussus salilacus]USZ67110.1 MarR family transcriptional regulator [Halorussus salilacus]